MANDYDGFSVGMFLGRIEVIVAIGYIFGPFVGYLFVVFDGISVVVFDGIRTRRMCWKYRRNSSW